MPEKTLRAQVAILMGTKNGERFLAEQLDSLETQTHQHWILYVSDDGSTDNTLSILKEYQAKWPAGKMIIRAGPRQGFCLNFLSLACDSSIRAEFYAFCDQDDVWLPNKLRIAIQKIQENQKNEIPYVYCSRTIFVNKNLKKLGISPLYIFPLTFRNALVQCIAGGNTMVFNQACKELLEIIGLVKHSSHDWWIYQIVTAIEGYIFYDYNPQLLYRQHRNALVGRNDTVIARIERTLMILNGEFRSYNDQNIEALWKVKHLISKNNIEILNLFKKMRNSNFKERLRLMEVCGLYRQTWRSSISFFLANLFKKI